MSAVRLGKKDAAGTGARVERVNAGRRRRIVALVAAALALLASAVVALGPSCGASGAAETAYQDQGVYAELGDAGVQDPAAAVDLATLPAFDETSPVAQVNDGLPGFSDELSGCTTSFEAYAPLDELGRCGAALACIGPDLLCDDERGSIGMVKPTGWQLAKYDFVDGKYLYNRCHLIAFMLTGENANELNLVTGTRYLNVQGMLPYETLVHDYVEQTGNHVLYRVTPVFEGDEPLMRGVQLEGWSVEDGGAGVCFNVFAYNCQPGVVIDYATGLSEADPAYEAQTTGAAAQAQPSENGAAPVVATEGDGETDSVAQGEPTYILNTNTHKFHYPWCSSVDDMSEKNKQEFFGTSEQAQAQGYEPCKRCNP